MCCKPNSRGFTLIEIMVAIVLFLIGAIAVARLQTTSIKGGTFGKEAMAANMVAQKLIEQLRDQNLYSFATVCNGGGAAQAVDAAYNVPTMTIQWSAGKPQGTAPYQYTTVTVTVTWSGKTQNYAAIVTQKNSGEGASASSNS